MTALDDDVFIDPPTYRPPMTLEHARTVLEQDGADSAGYAQAVAMLSIGRSLERIVALLEQQQPPPASEPLPEPRPGDEWVVMTCSQGLQPVPMRRREAERLLEQGLIRCAGEHRIEAHP